MTAGVNVFIRVVINISIAVEGLAVKGPGHHGIRLREPPQLRVVVAGAVVVEPGEVVVHLVRIFVPVPLVAAVLGNIIAEDLAEGQVVYTLEDIAVPVGNQPGRAEMVLHHLVLEVVKELFNFWQKPLIVTSFNDTVGYI